VVCDPQRVVASQLSEFIKFVFSKFTRFWPSAHQFRWNMDGHACVTKFRDAHDFAERGSERVVCRRRLGDIAFGLERCYQRLRRLHLVFGILLTREGF
jgi:hypothetical protein